MPFFACVLKQWMLNAISKEKPYVKYIFISSSSEKDHTLFKATRGE